MKCPKCAYTRTAIDDAPDYECPKCGIVYAKFDPAAEALKEALRAKVAVADIAPKQMQGDIREVQTVVNSDNQQSSASNSDDKPVKTVPGNLAVCKHCEAIGQVETKLPGSSGVEVAMFLLFFFPGIIYYIWRRTSKQRICSSCGSDQLVAARTHVGKKIILAQYPTFKIGENYTEEKYIRPTFGKMTVYLFGSLCLLFILLAVTSFSLAKDGEMVAIIQLLWAALFGFISYKLKNRKPRIAKSTGKALIEW